MKKRPDNLFEQVQEFCRQLTSFITLALICVYGFINFATAQKSKLLKIEQNKPLHFEKNILSIFQTKCLACHSKSLALGNVVLENSETILAGTPQSSIVTPRNADASKLFRVAAHLDEPFMPPPGNDIQPTPMTPEELKLLKNWIDQGALGADNDSLFTQSQVKWKSLPSTVTPIYSAAITPDSQYVACGRSNQIFLYHLISGRIVQRLVDPDLLNRTKSHTGSKTAHHDLVYSLAFSPKGNLLISGGYRTIKFWRSNRQENPNLVLDRVIGNVEDPSKIIGRVTALAFSPDGKLLATGSGESSRAGELKIWSVENAKLVKEISDPHSDTIMGLEFSPDGKFLATASTDRLAKIFDVSTSQLVHLYEGHSHHVLDVTWKADGKVLASCGADGVIKLWDTETGEQKETIEGYEKEITSLSFIGKTDQLLASSGDPTVRRGQQRLRGISTFVHTSVVSADGKTVVAGDQDGRLFIWHTPDIMPVHILRPTAVSPTIPLSSR